MEEEEHKLQSFELTSSSPLAPDQDLQGVSIIEGIVGYSDPLDLDRGIITEEVRKSVEEDLLAIGEDLGEPSVFSVIPYKAAPVTLGRAEGFMTALQLHQRESNRRREITLSEEAWYHVGSHLVQQDAYLSLSRLRRAGVSSPIAGPDVLKRMRLQRLEKRVLALMRERNWQGSPPADLATLKTIAVILLSEASLYVAEPFQIAAWWYDVTFFDDPLEWYARAFSEGSPDLHSITFRINRRRIRKTGVSLSVGQPRITFTADEERIEVTLAMNNEIEAELIREETKRQLNALLLRALPELYT